MALNWVMLDQQRAPVPLRDEITVFTIDSGAEVTLYIPDAPPSQGSSAGGAGGIQKLKETGQICLTDQRVRKRDHFVSLLDSIHLIQFPTQFLFIGPPKSTFETLTVPLTSIISTSFEQPVFGTNFLAFEIKPSPDGGLSPGTKAEVRLKDRGLFQLVSVLEKSRERAIYMKRQQASDEDTLRMWCSTT